MKMYLIHFKFQHLTSKTDDGIIQNLVQVHVWDECCTL